MIAAKIGVVIAVATTARDERRDRGADRLAVLGDRDADAAEQQAEHDETMISARTVTIISSRIDQKRPDTSSNERPIAPNDADPLEQQRRHRQREDSVIRTGRG